MRLDVKTCPLETLNHTTVYLNDVPFSDLRMVIVADEEQGFIMFHALDKDLAGNIDGNVEFQDALFNGYKVRVAVDKRYRGKNGEPITVKRTVFGDVRIEFDEGFEPKGMQIDNSFVDLSRYLDKGDET